MTVPRAALRPWGPITLAASRGMQFDKLWFSQRIGRRIVDGDPIKQLAADIACEADDLDATPTSQ